jgi:hypothetical protein
MVIINVGVYMGELFPGMIEALVRTPVLPTSKYLRELAEFKASEG